MTASSHRDRRLAFWGLLLTTALAMVAEGVVNVNLLPYAASLGVPAAGLGALFATHRLVRIAAAPWLGVLADRVGRRPLLLLGLACAGGALLVLAIAGGFLPLLGARLLYGAASALLITAGTAAVLDLSGPRDRGGALGLYQAALYGVYPVGSAIGGFLTDRWGYTTTFLACTAMVLCGAAVAVATVRETRHGDGAGDEVSHLQLAAGTVGPRMRLRDYPRLLRGDLRRYTALKMLSGFALWGVMEATFVLFLLSFLGQQTSLFGIPMGTRSVAGLLIATLLILGYLLGSPTVGYWSDRAGRRLRLVFASLLLTAAGLVALAAAPSAELIIVPVLAFGLAVALANAPLAALVGEAADPEARAATMAAYATLSDAANSAGAILGTSLALSAGYRPVYTGTALLVCAGAALLLPYRQLHRPCAGVAPAGTLRDAAHRLG